MPRIFDNIEKLLLPALEETLQVAERADFCVGYFNLRGWRHLAKHVDRWAGGESQCCRLLVGMHVTPTDELRHTLRSQEEDALDNQTAIREKHRIAEEFRSQLTFGVPTNEDEPALRQLAGQIRATKLVVKVYLRHSLHAKLYLLHRQDANNPVTGFLGSSNLTLAGLNRPGYRQRLSLAAGATGAALRAPAQWSRDQGAGARLGWQMRRLSPATRRTRTTDSQPDAGHHRLRAGCPAHHPRNRAGAQPPGAGVGQ